MTDRCGHARFNLLTRKDLAHTARRLILRLLKHLVQRATRDEDCANEDYSGCHHHRRKSQPCAESARRQVMSSSERRCAEERNETTESMSAK